MHRSGLSKFCYFWLCSWKIWNIYYHLFQWFVVGIYLQPLLFSPLHGYCYFWSGVSLFAFAMGRVCVFSNNSTIVAMLGIFVLKSVTFVLIVTSLPKLENNIYDQSSFLARFVYELLSAIISLMLIKQ